MLFEDSEIQFRIPTVSLRIALHVTRHVALISARCVARDLHTIVPGHIVRVGDGSWRSEENVKQNIELLL